MLIVLTVLISIGGTSIIAFQSRWVQTKIISAITKNIAEKTDTDISIKRVRLKFFRKVVLEEFYMSDQQKDTLMYVDRLVANIDSLSFRNKQLNLQSVVLDSPGLYIKKDDSGRHNFKFLIDYFVPESGVQQNKWRIKCNTFKFDDGYFLYSDTLLDKQLADLLEFSNLNLEVSDLKILPGNIFSLKISDFDFTSKTGLLVEKLNCELDYSDSTLQINNVFIQTLHSQIKADSLHIGFADYLLSKNLNDLIYDADIEHIDFGFKDIAYWASAFAEVNFNAVVSGRIRGTIDQLRGRDFKMNIGDFTRLNGDFYINGLPEYRSAYIFFDLNESFANLNEIRSLDLPPNMKKSLDNLPSFLDNVGEFSYSGNFTGFVDNFVAYGTAYSNLGTLRTDISFRPHKQEELFISGFLSAVNLDIGKIFDNDKLDKLTLNGEISGTLDYNSKFDLIFDGRVDSVDFNKNRFRMIDIDGSMINERFAGTFSIADSNLMMDFSGKLDLSPELPVFEFNADISHVDFKNLNFLPEYHALASLKIDANFQGNSIDNVVGNLVLSEIYFENENDSIFIECIELNNTTGVHSDFFTLKSDLIDGEILGRYSFYDLKQSFETFYSYYLPSSYIVDKLLANDINNFNFSFNAKDLNPLARLFLPGFIIEENIEINGYYRPKLQLALLETTDPTMQSGNKKIEGLNLRLEANPERIDYFTNTKKASIGERFNLYNFAINSSGSNDNINFEINWNNYSANKYSGQITGKTIFTRNGSKHPLVEIEINPSDLYFADSLWHIDQTRIVIDSTSIAFNNFSFYHENQVFNIDGAISEDESSEAKIFIHNVDMLLFEPLMGKSPFSGRINGNASLIDFYSRFMLNIDLAINNLAFKEGLLGELTLKSHWDNEHDKLISDLLIVDGHLALLSASGTIDPLNSYLDLMLQLDHTPVEILEVFMPPTFNRFEGLVGGNVHLYGKTKHIKLNGSLKPVTRAKLGLTYLNTVYSFSDPVHFQGDSIVFRNMSAYDEFGNHAFFRGHITHETFNRMKYFLSVETLRTQIMNTTMRHNEYFYGTAFVSGNFDITGSGEDILISGDIKSERGTVINIPFETPGNARKYDFIEFVGTEQHEQENRRYNVVTSGLNMNFDLEVTPDARVQIIFNTQMGDIIRGAGRGNLQVRIDKNYNIELYGNYTIEEGDYLFTLQNVVNKRFSILRGSTMEWIGDPYDAVIDILAVYKLKTSLHDLFIGSYENLDLSRRIPVDCVIHLTETLNEPNIEFSIDLPTAEERVKDEVQQMMATTEDVNRQFISLLMLGRFYTPEFFAGRPAGGAGAELAGTTATELLSNQITNWLSQISNTFDLGINYRPGNEITDEQIELAISTQILNDRVTLNGNFANNANPNSQNNSDIIGDFDVNVKLVESGRLQFKAYNRSNDYLIYATAPYTQGIGFSYREDFNSVRDLIERYKAILFRRNKNNTPDANEDIFETSMR